MINSATGPMDRSEGNGLDDSRITLSACGAIIIVITGTDFQNHIFDKERNLWIPDSAA